MTLIRWDPWRDLETVRRGLIPFVEPSLTARGRREVVRDIALDVSDEEDAYVVHASLPGFEPDEVHVSITGRKLTISGESKQEGERTGDDYLLRERFSGVLSRTVFLPTEVDVKEAAAEHKNGVLLLRLPKSAGERTRKIPVKAA